MEAPITLHDQLVAKLGAPTGRPSPTPTPALPPAAPELSNTLSWRPCVAAHPLAEVRTRAFRSLVTKFTGGIPGWAAADLAAGELSCDDVVRPLPGLAMTYPKAEAVGAVYEAALRADGIDLGDDSTSRGGPLVALPGSYRRLRQRVPDLECERIRYTGDDEQLLVTDYDAAIGRTDATTAADATAPH